MTLHADEHERTMAFAEIALGQIRALRQPATPRHFEIWYTYATGYSPSLNQMINEMLTRNGTLSDADINQIYETYISSSRFTDRIDHVGSKVMGEIEQVMAMIGAAAGNASSYTESLADVTQKLGVAADEPAVRAIVESLVQATKEMEKNNQALEERLIGLQAGDHPAPAESRNRPQREPDRSPHLARQPQVSSTTRWPRPSPTRAPRASRCR